jgi:hypothetical protein
VGFDVLGDAAGTREARRATGVEVAEALGAQGLPVSWTGDPDDRLWVEPFRWQRRRWTKAPSSPPRPVAWRQAPRLAPRLGLSPADLAPYRQEVRAFSSTYAFDTFLATLYRGVWRACGGEHGQVGHHGPPHTFVRAGETTVMTPCDGLANLDPERAAMLRRDARRRRTGDGRARLGPWVGAAGGLALALAVAAAPPGTAMTRPVSWVVAGALLGFGVVAPGAVGHPQAATLLLRGLLAGMGAATLIGLAAR